MVEYVTFFSLLSENQLIEVDTATGLLLRNNQIAEDLNSGIHLLERTHHRSDTKPIGEDIRLISILWTYGAQILRQTVTSDLEPAHANLGQAYVNACLEKLEELPTRLVMRASWPYPITGCMSTSESQHERFRRELGRTMQEAQPPGIAWKGLIVMEVCWKLRRVEGDGRIGWREAMERLGARVLLTWKKSAWRLHIASIERHVLLQRKGVTRLVDQASLHNP